MGLRPRSVRSPVAFIAACSLLWVALVGAVHRHLEARPRDATCAVCATLGTTSHAVATKPVLAPAPVATCEMASEPAPRSWPVVVAIPRPPRGPPASVKRIST